MKLVVIEPLGVAEETLRSLLTEKLPEDMEIAIYDTRATDPGELIRRGLDADIILVANQPLDGDVIRGCKKLKLLSVAFTGVDHIDLDACREKGVTVCNSAGYSTAAVADLVFGMAISLLRRLPECGIAVRQGGTRDGLVGQELEGKNFGVIGTGAIGLRVAAIAHAFGCRVTAYSRTQKDIPFVTYAPLDSLLEICDIVSLHVPLNEHTRGMIGERELSLMRPDAILINTARGPLVDDRALADALHAGKLGGAGVDVFDTEPPLDPSLPLLSSPRTILSPHVGFATVQALLKRAVIVAENAAGWLAGKPQNVIR